MDYQLTLLRAAMNVLSVARTQATLTRFASEDVTAHCFSLRTRKRWCMGSLVAAVAAAAQTGHDSRPSCCVGQVEAWIAGGMPWAI